MKDAPPTTPPTAHTKTIQSSKRCDQLSRTATCVHARHTHALFFLINQTFCFLIEIKTCIKTTPHLCWATPPRRLFRRFRSALPCARTLSGSFAAVRLVDSFSILRREFERLEVISVMARLIVGVLVSCCARPQPSLYGQIGPSSYLPPHISANRVTRPIKMREAVYICSPPFFLPLLDECNNNSSSLPVVHTACKTACVPSGCHFKRAPSNPCRCQSITSMQSEFAAREGRAFKRSCHHLDHHYTLSSHHYKVLHIPRLKNNSRSTAAA